VGAHGAPGGYSTECYAMMLRHNDSGSQSVLHASTESSKLWFIFGKMHRATMDVSDTLPDDIDALRALLLAERASRAAIVAERDKLVVRNERLEAIIAEIRRAHFGRKSERITDDQLSLALEELETSLAKAEAEDEKADPALKTAATRKRRASRNENLDHLPHEEVVIEPESKACPCCGGELHVIGEDTSKRLDKVPAKVRVIVTRRAKYACRSCEKTGADTVAGVIQAAAPARLIEGGLPTEAMVADVVVSQARRSSSIVSAIADPLPPWREDRALDLGSVGRRRGRRVAASARSSDQSAQSVTAPVLRRDALSGARSGRWQDQDRIPVGDRA
jgi:transposase